MHQRIPELLRKLFQISAAADSKALKDKAMSFVRNGLVKAEAEQGVQRKQWFITSAKEEATLYNALLLNAFFPDPKRVKAVFDNSKIRLQSAEIIRSLILDQQSLLGLSLVKPEAHLLILNLFDIDSFKLKERKLPNPFQTLPQLALGNGMGLMQALIAQSSSLDSHDSLLAAYLSQDWEEAMKLIRNLEELGSDQDSYRSLINAVKIRYYEAQEFDQLINLFKKNKKLVSALH